MKQKISAMVSFLRWQHQIAIQKLHATNNRKMQHQIAIYMLGG